MTKTIKKVRKTLVLKRKTPKKNPKPKKSPKKKQPKRLHNLFGFFGS